MAAFYGTNGPDYSLLDPSQPRPPELGPPSGSDAPRRAIPGENPYELLYGLGGEDILWVQGNFSAPTWVRFYGGDDNDTLLLTSTNGNAVGWFYGGNGNDYITFTNAETVGFGLPSLIGEDGDDVLIADPTPTFTRGVYMDGGSGHDYLSGGLGPDQLYGGDGDDRPAFVVTAGAARAGAVTRAAGIFGNAGDDWLYGGNGNDYLDGGADNDSLWGGNDFDELYGRSGNDWLYGEAGTDGLVGGDGADYLSGGADNDTLWGNDNIDDAWDLVDGGNTVMGGDGDDWLFGAAAADSLYGGNGADNIFGGSGNDTIFASIGGDAVSGGLGIDTYDSSWSPSVAASLDAPYADAPYFLAVDLANARAVHYFYDGSQTTFISSDVEIVIGLYAAPSSLVGNDLDNTLIGGNADDYLAGGGGDDSLDGGGGNDIFSMGAGNDTLDGGAGDADRVYLNYRHDDALTVTTNGSDLVITGGLGTTVLRNIELAAYSDAPDTFFSIASLQLTADDYADTIDGSPWPIGNLTSSAAAVSGSIGWAGDRDLFRLSLVAGQPVAISLRGELSGSGTLHDPYVRLLDASGTEIANDDDSAGGLESRLVFMASATGTYFVSAGGYDDTGVGSYSLSAAAAFTTGNDVALLSQPGVTWRALDGNDSVDGSAGNDTIDGGNGSDTLRGAEGDDWLVGGAGPDTLDGGFGNDGIGYGSSNAAVTIDLAAGTSHGGDAEGDVISNVERVYASGFSDVVTGNAADNVLDGGSGNDTLRGEIGNDTLKGGNGTDWLIGGAGADSLIGGAGTDWAAYGTAQQGVIASLATGTGWGGDASGDTFTGIENLYGSNFGDTIYGNAAANALTGAAGWDWLIGMGGADTLNGGAGSDWASYGSSSASVTVSLATGTGSGGDAQGDALISIENLYGSSFADTLTGNAGANSIRGADGGDTIAGGAGNDTLVGGVGNDVYAFANGTGVDTITDFAAGGTDDRIDLHLYAGLGITAFAQLQTSGRLSTVSGHAELALNGGDKVILQNVGSHMSLTAADFTF